MPVINQQQLVVADQFGNDVLQHQILSRLNEINRWENLTLDAEYESNPQLLAQDFLKDPELFYVILAFNGISDGFSLEAGQNIRIPDIKQVTNLRRSVQQNQPRRTTI